MSTATPIFAEHAAHYWAAGLQVMPLHTKSKRPIFNDWSRLAETPVTQEEQEKWIRSHATSNMGLVLGKSSNVCMVDIDTDDPAIFNAIMKCLPPSAWERKGKKGMMLAYKFSGLKTFRVKNASGETMVEVLSSRTQCVLPPSIHPDTNLPYVSNTNLYEVTHQLVALPDNIEELLRDALKLVGVELSHSGWSKVTEYVPAGARDTTLTEMAGLFAYAVVRGERTLKEAIGMLRSFHGEFIEQTTGDMVGADKHVENLIKFLERDVKDKGKILPKGWDSDMTEDEKVDLGLTVDEDNVEWDFEKIIEFLRLQFEQDIEGKARNDAVEAILKRMSRSPNLTRIEEDQILKYIHEVARLGVPLASFKARLRELRQGDVVGQDHSEIARATLEDLSQTNLLRFHGGKFMKWGGSHWVPFDQMIIMAHISANYGHLPAARKHNDLAGIMKIIGFLVEQGIVKVPMKGVNFANGFLTEELKLVPHNPDFGMTYTLPFRYVPELAGKFDAFERFLNSSWGADHDYAQKLDALQEVLCVTLFGLGSRFQKAVLLHGVPQSGKTQLLRIVSTLVPNEARCALPPDKWDDKFMSVVMHGKILNVVGELSEKRISGQVYKDVVDGSERPAQFKNQQVFQMKPELTHWFASNHLPKTDDTSYGFIRRWLILTFHYPVAKDKIERDLGDRIAAEERESIVAWAVLALNRLKETNNYTSPVSYEMLVKEFANINNSVRMFMVESTKVKFGVEGGFVQEAKLYNSYWSWTSASGGSKPVSLPKFRAMIRELQSELKFKLTISTAVTGGTDAILEGIGLAV